MKVSLLTFQRVLFIILIGLILVFFGILLFINFTGRYQSINDGVSGNDTPVTTTEEPTVATDTPSASETTIKSSVLLDVDFTSQAPLSNWDTIHEETCEEASLLMVKYYINKASLPGSNEVDSELLSLVEWETAHGYSQDVTVKQLSDIAKLYYGIGNSLIIENPTVDSIKEQLSLGHSVILPAAGRLLDNPNFRNGGPVYHMLVVKGYNDTHFITNDPGTRKGNGFVYTYENLMNAIHDWDPTNILNGRRAVLVLY